MIPRHFAAAALIALAAVAPASAYTVKSSVECPDILREDSDETFREMNKWWLMGYFTGRNYVDDAEVGREIEDENIYQMALDYCRGNSGNDWDDAAIHIYDRLD
jgi:hypothetical protein